LEPGGRISPAGWLRLVLRSLALLAWLLGCLLLYLLCSPLPCRNPASRLFLTGVLRIVGGQLTVTGEPARAPSILLANHLSWIDIPALAAAAGSAFVAHEGLADQPVMRFLCKLNHTVFIARSDRASVAGQVDQVREGLHDSGVLTLFPEGTTGDDTALLPFKSSLLAAVEGSASDVAICPVCLDYRPLTAQLAWVGDEPGLSNFKRVLARPGRFAVAVHLLPPLRDDERRNRKTIAAATYQAVAAKLA
jgi:1-acyl-sn-glycerol-3-phosphate acyltransferase